MSQGDWQALFCLAHAWQLSMQGVKPASELRQLHWARVQASQSEAACWAGWLMDARHLEKQQGSNDWAHAATQSSPALQVSLPARARSSGHGPNRQVAVEPLHWDCKHFAWHSASLQAPHLAARQARSSLAAGLASAWTADSQAAITQGPLRWQVDRSERQGAGWLAKSAGVTSQAQASRGATHWGAEGPSNSIQVTACRSGSKAA